MPPRFNPHAPSQFFITQQRIENPAPAAHAAFTVPAGYTYQFLTISATLVTSAAAANRHIEFSAFDFFSRRILQATLQQNIPANTTVYFRAGHGFIPRLPTQQIDPSEISLPLNHLIPGGISTRVGIINVQAGDQLSDIFFIAKQFYRT